MLVVIVLPTAVLKNMPYASFFQNVLAESDMSPVWLLSVRPL